ncbi:MAG TPA: tRNA pseudouridine(38-40) synthase TruA [Chlamydiales bacterium]|nr:tRNA pseudouridine(38-40) synthase TruA [Chlamydiales bacterium]
MKHHFHAIVAYDGTNYFGWQATKSGPSIQKSLAIAIEKVTQEKVIPEAASRTDRGVHAEGQSISFVLSKPWDPHRLKRAMNTYLPPDIRVRQLNETFKDFHPTIQAVAKVYNYRLSLTPFQIPFDRLYAWHFPRPIDREVMEKSAALLLGSHNFSSFTSRADKRPVCTLFSIETTYLDRTFQISLKGDRFLYKMARTIVGTLIYIGAGKLPIDIIVELLSCPDRRNAGMTAPAHGLFLSSVIYSPP